MSDDRNLLGDFLRARRELISPDQVGIPVHGLRRVRGLRREEVAMLAGISADYYLRLEQGRDRRPSVQVLESIARALRLDAESAAYLAGLAGDGRKRRRRAAKETVPAGIRKLVATLPLPAFVEGRYLDVLAANALATAISPRLAVGGNRLRDVFLDPAEQALIPDWEVVTRGLIAGFRQSVGADVGDQRSIDLVGELTLASPRFVALWARHDVGPMQGGLMRFDHPQVGEIVVNREKLAIPGTEGMMLVVYHADAGTENAEKLALLASASLSPVAPKDRETRSPRT
ncbi:helix-turn-helix domain-containing protein [Amycolatopsis sp. WQ 127309]|uniref:helix-turn-helix domain-containing protein n=1 Tax=Amycolatopsis sp. WQ 127309 TaxID=2932773 RepID=UPI001FF2F345|nr:helix-turn-helix transcriptional regulator [Amycolatopsis sp. WQ 127309]UOZ06026.1 helix-turn-helix transcriptional regulator [Amycolatopsis sp. WQ 127309]